jgi:hypothetical protein
LPASQKAEDDPVDGVREDQRRAREKEEQKPAMPDVEKFHLPA